MGHLNHRSVARYAPPPPPPPPQYHPINPHYRRHDFLIPRSVIVNPTAPDFHPHPLFIHHPPPFLDLDLRRRLSMASPPPYSPTASPNHRLVESNRDGTPARKWRAKNKNAGRVLRDSSFENGDESHASELGGSNSDRCTPTKQVQRKSVFLRIQMPEPNNGNGENDETEELQNDDCAVDSNPNSNPSGGEGNHECLGNIEKGKERGGGEFDAPLESASLVAEPVGVPLSSAIVSNPDMASVTDTDLTPRGKKRKKKKKRKAMDSHIVPSDSQLVTLSTGAVNSNSMSCLAYETSNSGKDLISQKNVSDPCSQLCSGSTNNPPGKTVPAESDYAVAKPMGVPLSSVIVSNSDMVSVSDTDLTPKGKKRKNRKNRKKQKALVFGSVSSDSQLVKLSTGAVNLNSLPCLANETSNSGKNLNLQKNVSDPCSSSTKNTPGKIIPLESDSPVAKPIGVPLSSAIVSNSDVVSVSHTDLTPPGKKRKKKKKRKALVYDGVSSDSQPVKLSTVAVNSYSLSCLANETSNSGKELVIQKNVSGPCSQPLSSSTNKPPGKIVPLESDSLVAKPIVVRLSSAIVSNPVMVSVSDTDLTPKGKKRKALVSDSVSSDSQLVKLSTGAVNSNSLSRLANETSNSGNNLISQKNASDPCSRPCSGSTNNPPGKIKAAQSSKGIVKDEIGDMHSGKTSSRVVKKKIIVRRVVKKVVKPNSNRSSSMSTCMLDGMVKADSVTLSSLTASASVKIKKISSKDKSAALDKVTIPGCFQSLPSEGNLLPGDNKGDVPVQSLATHSRPQECNTDKDSNIGIESGGDISKPTSCASSKEDERTDPDYSDANNSASAIGLLSNSMVNTDEPTKSLNGSPYEFNHTDDDTKQSCQNEVSLSPGKDSNIGNLQNRVQVGDAKNCRLLSSADNVSNTCLPSTHNSISASGRVAGLSSNNLTGFSEENFTVCGVGNNGVVGKASCESNVPTLSQDAILEENPDITIPATSSGMVGFSSSTKTVIQDVPDCLQLASVVKQGSDHELSNSKASITFPHVDIIEDTGKQVPHSNVIVSPENCDIQSFPNSDTLVGYGEGDTNEITKRKFRTLLKFSPSKMESLSPDVESLVFVNAVDTTSNTLKDPSPSEILDQSVQRLDFYSQSSIDGITTLNVKRRASEAQLLVGNNGDNDANKASRLYKREKTNVSYPNFTQCPSELSDATVATTSCAEVPDDFSYKQAHKKEVALLSRVVVSSPSVPYTEDSAKLPEKSFGRESFESMDLNRETVTSGSLALLHSSIASHSLLEDSVTPIVQFPMLEGQQEENAFLSVPRESFDSMDLHRATVTPDSLVFRRLSIASHSLLEHSATSDVQFPMLEGEHRENASPIVPSNTETGILDHAARQSNLTKRKMRPQPSLVPSKVATQQSNCSELNWRKKEPGCVFPKTSKGYSFRFSKSKASQPRTWRRTGNNSPASLPGSKPSVRTVPPEKTIVEMNNSLYIRKGNSLVRKPTPVSAPSQISVANQSPCLGFDEFRKGIRSESRVDVTDQLNLLETGVKNAPVKGQRILPLPIDTKLQNGSSPMKVNLSVGCCENPTDTNNVMETDDAPNTSEDVLKNSETFENQIGPSNNRASQVEVNDGNISSSNAKRIAYLKPKLNQLVATSNSCDLFVSTDDKTQTACSGGYYKSKNQIRRTSLVSHISSTATTPKSNVNSEGIGSCKVIGNMRFTKSWSQKGHYPKFLSKLIPWKRSIFLRRSVHNPTSMSHGSSLSAIRNRDAVYTRLTYGFLWKSKVLGVGRSSFKCSKCIDRRSTKVNKESTLAAKEGYIPRRLVIAKNVYSRFGNANQLIRDPKKRTQTLASEKVRWSLHTARQQLARKQKYCQFFTRFGKCNKDDGKCPYIHDPSKIAVCAKFLNGLCSNANCVLTHEVIPERMPDCSYFLKGLCTNRNCPYRHVNVNPKASICEEFLKGYCADGDECRKKHSYVCPTFEAKGNCEKGTQSKLHHPKKQSEGKKRKRSGDQIQNNSRGRYFGSLPIDISDPGMVAAQRQRQQSNDREGEGADYISFEVEEEAAESVYQSYEQATLCDSDPWDLQLHNDLDELTRPE